MPGVHRHPELRLKFLHSIQHLAYRIVSRYVLRLVTAVKVGDVLVCQEQTALGNRSLFFACRNWQALGVDQVHFDLIGRLLALLL